MGSKKHIPVLTLYIIGLVDFFLGVQKYAPNATVTRDLGNHLILINSGKVLFVCGVD